MAGALGGGGVLHHVDRDETPDAARRDRASAWRIQATVASRQLPRYRRVAELVRALAVEPEAAVAGVQPRAGAVAALGRRHHEMGAGTANRATRRQASSMTAAFKPTCRV